MSQENQSDISIAEAQMRKFSQLFNSIIESGDEETSSPSPAESLVQLIEVSKDGELERDAQFLLNLVRRLDKRSKRQRKINRASQ